MSGSILVFNSGSSSIKFALYTARAPAERLLQGSISGLGAKAAFEARGAGGDRLPGQLPSGGTVLNHERALAWLLDWLAASGHGRDVRGAGHRVVHGGEQHSTPALIDERVLAELEQLIPMAPLHQPHNLAAVRALRALQPGLPQVACFDTAFHRGQPAAAQRFALPREITESGVRRYGFHGLSYEYISGALPQHLHDAAHSRVIIAHLGNGASLCALSDGRSVATTMGFTALDGLMMGTRSGTVDPGVLFYLMRERGMTPDVVEDMLYRRSGLLGVSGITADMRELLESTDPRAAEAVDLFVYRTLRELGSLAAALGGLDALVFTAGIGERSATIRSRICAGLAWLGVELDEAANAAQKTRISAPSSRIPVAVIPTDEEIVIARHTIARLGPAAR